MATSAERKQMRALVVVRSNADRPREESGSGDRIHESADSEPAADLPSRTPQPDSLDSVDARRRGYFEPGGYAAGYSIRARLATRTSRPRE
jgi:hypothetical protein